MRQKWGIVFLPTDQCLKLALSANNYMVNHTSLVTEYPKDCIDTKFIEIDTRFTKNTTENLSRQLAAHLSQAVLCF